MKSKPCFLTFILLVVSVTSAHPQNAGSSNSQVAMRPRTVVPAPAEALDISRQNQDEPVTLRIFAGKSTVLRSPEVLKRVSITDPAIATAIIVSPNQLLIHGLLPGSVTLILWDEQERTRTFDLQVEMVDCETLAIGPRKADGANRRRGAGHFLLEHRGDAFCDSYLGIDSTEGQGRGVRARPVHPRDGHPLTRLVCTDRGAQAVGASNRSAAD